MSAAQWLTWFGAGQSLGLAVRFWELAFAPAPEMRVSLSPDRRITRRILRLRARNHMIVAVIQRQLGMPE